MASDVVRLICIHWSFFRSFEPVVEPVAEFSNDKGGGLGWYAENLLCPLFIDGVESRLLIWVLEPPVFLTFCCFCGFSDDAAG